MIERYELTTQLVCIAVAMYLHIHNGLRCLSVERPALDR